MDDYVPDGEIVWLDWTSIEAEIKRVSGWTENVVSITKESVDKYSKLSCDFLNSLPNGFGIKVKRGR